jgi:dihydroneopterin aldolase
MFGREIVQDSLVFQISDLWSLTSFFPVSRWKGCSGEKERYVVGEQYDRIILNGMQFYGYHGVMPAEQELGQPFIVDLELSCDLREAGRKDDLTKTIDYSQVFELTQQIVTGEPCLLIETVAERIAASVLGEFPVVEVLVRVRKPHAPLKGFFADAAVEIRRQCARDGSCCT